MNQDVCGNVMFHISVRLPEKCCTVSEIVACYFKE
ncbi:unnamed protein product [Acanthoscelides obtectus]|uniref:Uncharacterized protein n=1 Tax=Acanthoscelides obtectus TaxID=200917 RepID=A0A9P0LII6_ACAOB|nr:unnamed protein product [Acanthoscelides obtectus]CAK1658982.1 hypothetical protein AOBTE_LOCUS21228 [Acanthoscelides obtectus]